MHVWNCNFFNECDDRISSIGRSEKGLNNSGLNRDLNADLCNASTVLYQLSFQADREQVVMWVIYKPVDAEIDDDNTIFCILNAE